MKHIVFLTINDIESINESTIYNDLIHDFINRNYKVTIVSPTSIDKKPCININNNLKIIKPKIINYKTKNILVKGLSLITLDYSFIKYVKKYLKNEPIDLVLYATPPISLIKTITYIKKKTGARSYLLLKDIFPQNAVDIDILRKTSIIYKIFRIKEKKLYKISDKIGCMSKRNVDYVLKNNPEIKDEKVEVNPNSIDVSRNTISKVSKKRLREKYNLPQNKKIYVYGGNVGRPQGIDFLLEVIKLSKSDNHFLIIGDGTDFYKINEFKDKYGLSNLTVLTKAPVSVYLELVSACDIGIILLDKRFTIPNFPSRILSYMLAKLPVIALTDKQSDIGSIITDNNFGFWAEHGDIKATLEIIDRFKNENIINEMGKESYNYLINNYQTSVSSTKIINFLEE